ncbi:MAG: PorT family protein [Muribaculaceae bacterium]|nr:PorT family protein [Muribaculaceae bacterium]
MKLRNILGTLLCSALLCLALPARAQTHYKPRISIGARGGMSMGEMSFSPSVNQKWMTGSTGAFTFRYTEEKIFGLIAELGWVQRGWKEDFEEAPLNYTRTLTYLQLPVLTHIYFGSKRFKAFVNLGPQICYLVSDNIKADFDYRHPEAVEGFPIRNRSVEQMYTEVKNKFDYGICASVGGEFFVQPRHSIFLEARYYFGLGNIFPSSKADTFSASRAMSLEFSIGYFFRLK